MEENFNLLFSSSCDSWHTGEKKFNKETRRHAFMWFENFQEEGIKFLKGEDKMDKVYKILKIF